MVKELTDSLSSSMLPIPGSFPSGVAAAAATNDIAPPLSSSDSIATSASASPARLASSGSPADGAASYVGAGAVGMLLGGVGGLVLAVTALLTTRVENDALMGKLIQKEGQGDDAKVPSASDSSPHVLSAIEKEVGGAVPVELLQGATGAQSIDHTVSPVVTAPVLIEPSGVLPREAGVDVSTPTHVLECRFDADPRRCSWLIAVSDGRCECGCDRFISCDGVCRSAGR